MRCVNADAFERLEKAGVEVCCSVHREDAHSESHYDFRPREKREGTVKEPTDLRLVEMGEKLRTEEGKALYRKRCQTVEPVFGIIKAVMGFRGFSLRGKKKVSGEWTLVCLAYNVRRLHRMMGGSKNGPIGPETPTRPRKSPSRRPLSTWLRTIVGPKPCRFQSPGSRLPTLLALSPTGS